MAEIRRKDGGGFLILGEATIHEIQAFWSALGALIDTAPGPYDFDMSHLDALDAAGAQTLLAFCESAGAVARCFGWKKNHADYLNLLGLGGPLSSDLSEEAKPWLA